MWNITCKTDNNNSPAPWFIAGFTCKTDFFLFCCCVRVAHLFSFLCCVFVFFAMCLVPDVDQCQ